MLERVIALAGNPNVGKSTLFNSLTGMHQHTGNWTGKTVENAVGRYSTEKGDYILVDVPGTYSLIAHSAEEEVARNFICFGKRDAVAVVCDAACLERNLNLVLQITEVCPRTLVCVNLLDEAKRKGVRVDLEQLGRSLGLPVVGTVARKKSTLKSLIEQLDRLVAQDAPTPVKITYPRAIEKAIELVLPRVGNRWTALRLIEGDARLTKEIHSNLEPSAELTAAVAQARLLLLKEGITPYRLQDIIAATLMDTARQITDRCVTTTQSGYSKSDRKADRLLTGRVTAFPFMLLLLILVFWLTVSGANYPSQLLGKAFFWFEGVLSGWFNALGAPDWINGIIVQGAYRVLAWVVSVMLPPMAIFFPLFTLLEDSGYLPRIAYNLDRPFKGCGACGKQALTMCMGFGCNAAGVVGCRIIDSPRERLLATLTNSLVPCNGRFPTIITLITAFFVLCGGALSAILPSVILTAVIVLGVVATMLATRFLSKTLLKGVPSSFALELPPYRTPQFGQVLVRSVFDRTLFVLGRAVVVAAPAGALIWIMANVSVDGQTLLNICSNFLDPFARLMGLDGVILMAFILGFPANEIVIPIILMAYTAKGTLPDLAGVEQIKAVLVSNGWTWVTAACTVLFSLMHWPCSTTLMTVKKETGSLKWTAVAAVLPTAMGVVACMLVNFAAKLAGF